MYLGSVLINFVMQMQAHYVGKLENGKVFDSSYNRGKPLTFRVGVGEVCISLFEYVHNLQQLMCLPGPKFSLFVLWTSLNWVLSPAFKILIWLLKNLT